MLTDTEQYDLDVYKRDFSIMSVAEAMVEAHRYEDMASKTSSDNPAHTRYKNESNHYLNYAALLKKQAQS